MRSSVFGSSRGLYLAAYTAGSQQGKQHQFEAFFLTLKAGCTNTPLVVALGAINFHVALS
jgi:hypothetical protein